MRYKSFLTCLLLFKLALTACQKAEPIAFKAKVGMKKKEVEQLLGKPWYGGGFVSSVKPTEKYTPQRDRFLLFWVYPDSSLIVFKRDTVFEIYGNVRPYKQRLARQIEKSSAQKSAATHNSLESN